jgi:hypothetical protein
MTENVKIPPREIQRYRLFDTVFYVYFFAFYQKNPSRDFCVGWALLINVRGNRLLLFNFHLLCFFQPLTSIKCSKQNSLNFFFVKKNDKNLVALIF